MSAEEGDQYSSISASRKIKSSPSLRVFSKHVHTVLEGSKEMFDGRLDEAPEIVYGVNALRVVLFERRFKASSNINNLLRKLDAQLEPPKIAEYRRQHQHSGVYKVVRRLRDNSLHQTLRDNEELYKLAEGPLVARAVAVVDATKADEQYLGTELALQIDPASPAADVLRAQAAAIDARVRSIVAGQRLPRTDIDLEADALNIRFMRAPFVATSDRDEFIDALTTELPVHDLEILNFGFSKDIKDPPRLTQ